jgi:hypothetical protein
MHFPSNHLCRELQTQDTRLVSVAKRSFLQLKYSWAVEQAQSGPAEQSGLGCASAGAYGRE